MKRKYKRQLLLNKLKCFLAFICCFHRSICFILWTTPLNTSSRLYKVKSLLLKRGGNIWQQTHKTSHQTEWNIELLSSRSRIPTTNSYPVSWTLRSANQKQTTEVTSTDVTLDQLQDDRAHPTNQRMTRTETEEESKQMPYKSLITASSSL